MMVGGWIVPRLLLADRVVVVIIVCFFLATRSHQRAFVQALVTGYGGS
jgi:hypothetical protein